MPTGPVYEHRYDRDPIKRIIKNRKSVFLDSNVWIDLQKDTVPANVSARAKLQAAVRSGKVFCPISFPTIMEMFKQTEPDRSKTAMLMDELCCGVAFCKSSEIFDWEVKRYCHLAVNGQYAEADIVYAYAPMLGHVSEKICLGYKKGN